MVKPCVLLERAAEALVPVLSAYAGGTVAGRPDVAGAVEAAVDSFRDAVASAWAACFRQQPAEAEQALGRLAATAADEARREAAAVLDRLAPAAGVEDRNLALDFLARIPAALRAAGPPNGDLGRPEAVARLLPFADSLKRDADWPASAPADALQKRPEMPPLAGPALPDLDVRPLPPPGLQRSEADPAARRSLLTKLRLLARCHELVGRQWVGQRLTKVLVFLLVLIAGGFLSGGFGTAVHWMVYDSPQRYAKKYERNWPNPPEFYIRGEKVTEGQYDYFLSTFSDREIPATLAGVASGLGLFLLLLGLTWMLYLRRPPPPAPHLEEQVAALAAAHPEEVRGWGGPAVLRQPELVAELLRLEEDAGRKGVTGA
jgi:hypothetical protein